MYPARRSPLIRLDASPAGGKGTVGVACPAGNRQLLRFRSTRAGRWGREIAGCSFVSRAEEKRARLGKNRRRKRKVPVDQTQIFRWSSGRVLARTPRLHLRRPPRSAREPDAFHHPARRAASGTTPRTSTTSDAAYLSVLTTPLMVNGPSGSFPKSSLTRALQLRVVTLE
jgi:hypothetical protein